MMSSRQTRHSAPRVIPLVLLGLSIAVASFTATDAHAAPPAAHAADHSRDRVEPEYVLLCHAQDGPSSYAARKIRSELEQQGVPVRELPLDRLSAALRFEVDPPAPVGREGTTGPPALVHWDAVIETVDPYFDDMPLLHLGDAYITQKFDVMVDRFSWKHFRDQVQRDVVLARECAEAGTQ